VGDEEVASSLLWINVVPLMDWDWDAGLTIILNTSVLQVRTLYSPRRSLDPESIAIFCGTKEEDLHDYLKNYVKDSFLFIFSRNSRKWCPLILNLPRIREHKHA
jgi:hypothetical protein